MNIFVQWFRTLFLWLFSLLFREIFASFASTEALIYFRIKFELENISVSSFAKHENAEIVFFRIALNYCTNH